MTTRPSRRQRDKGAAAILVGVALLVLMGFAAIAIDASAAYNERRGTQNAADNAALAAAWQACNPDTVGSTPTNAARQTAKDNGYDHLDPNVTVTPTEWNPGVWEVEIVEKQSGIFGQATPYANDELTIVSRAVAECVEQDYLGGYALFAGGYGCSTNELDVTSSEVTVIGGIYSNENLKLSGSDINVGLVEHRDPSFGSYGGSATYDKGPAKSFPVLIDIADYRSGGDKRSDPNFVAAPGDITRSWLTTHPAGYATPTAGVGLRMEKSGIYYTPGKVDLKDISSAPGVEVTFVSEGPMDFQQPVSLTGYDQVLDTAYSPLVLFSNEPGAPSCNTTAIKFSTSGVKALTGLIYAPNGSVDFSAASVEIIGSVLAYSINASTSEITVDWQDAPGAPSDFEVNLLE